MHSDASGCVLMDSDTSRKYRKKFAQKSVSRFFDEVFEELCQNGHDRQALRNFLLQIVLRADLVFDVSF